MPEPSSTRNPVIAGVDGSPQSIAAAHWAAAEAVRRGLPLRLLHVWPWLPHLAPAAPSPSALQVETRRMLARVQADIRAEYPELDVETQLSTNTDPDGLVLAGRQAELLVLGSRGIGGFERLLLGSNSLTAAARAVCPVVLVRAAATEAATLSRPVVLGLDARHPSDALIEFALRAAEERGTTLRIVHTWGLPPLWSVNPLNLGAGEQGEMESLETQLLHDAVLGWHDKYPAVEIHPDVRFGSAAEVLVDESDRACLVVVGRHLHRPPLGLRLGPVVHSVIHYATCPVAVVPHS